MKVYKNPWVTREAYFIPTGEAKSAKNEGKKTAGYVVDFWQGKWNVRFSAFYNTSLNQMPVVAKTNLSLASVVNRAIVDAVLDAVGGHE